MRTRTRQLPFRLGFAAVAVVLLTGFGCLDEPEIEDRWTRLDFENSNVMPGQALPSGGTQTFSLQTSITYRSIHTGFAVAELRASPNLTGNDVFVHPNAARERMAYDIDRILANSVSVGRATRAVTGWDHLIQRIDFTFTGWVPATLDSAGVPIGPPTGLFLVYYLGSGVEIELANGQDSLIVTPFASAPNELLPVGMTLNIQ